MHLHNINKELRKTFSPGPMILIQSARKQSSYYVWNKLYLLQRKDTSSIYQVYNNVTDTYAFSIQWLETFLRLTIDWTVTISILSTLRPANSVTNNTRVKLRISFVIDGITIKIKLQLLKGKETYVKKHLHKHFQSELFKCGVSL